MSRIAYVAGQYLPHRQAGVHIEDRGFQFADGVYEVIAVSSGRLVDEAPHLKRLHRSLAELRIPAPMEDEALKIVIREIIRRNGVDTGIVYLQITRGAAPREHAFPKDGEAHPRRDRAPLATARSTLRRGRHRRHHHSRHPLAALRHQIGGAGRQCARQAGGPRKGRL